MPAGLARLGFARTGSRAAARLAASLSDTEDIFLPLAFVLPGRWARDCCEEDGPGWEPGPLYLREL